MLLLWYGAGGHSQPSNSIRRRGCSWPRGGGECGLSPPLKAVLLSIEEWESCLGQEKQKEQEEKEEEIIEPRGKVIPHQRRRLDRGQPVTVSEDHNRVGPFINDCHVLRRQDACMSLAGSKSALQTLTFDSTLPACLPASAALDPHGFLRLMGAVATRLVACCTAQQQQQQQ